MVPVSGRGTIYSFVIVHRPVLPAFQARLPLPVILVELEDHPNIRMVGNLVADPGDRLQIGIVAADAERFFAHPIHA